MRGMPVLALGCALALLLAVSAFSDEPARAAGFAWETDYAVALQRAKDEGKPIFLEFR